MVLRPFVELDFGGSTPPPPPWWNQRVLELEITDQANDTNFDDMNLLWSDALRGDGAIPSRPPLGQTIRVHVGWRGQDPVNMGTFQIVQVVQSKAPRALQFRGSSLVSQDLRLNAHQTLELQRVGKKTPLREVLLHMFTVSKNSDIRVSGTFLQGRPEGLTDEENPDSALNLPVEIIEWNDRSLMDMLEEYGQRYNLIIQIKADDHGRFVSVIERTKRNDIDEPIYEDQTTNWRVEQNQRTNYGNVSVWNINENYEQERTEASVAAPGQTWTPSFLASDGAGGAARARSELAALQRGVWKARISLPVGRPELAAGRTIQLRGFSPLIDRVDWRIAKATQTITPDQGWTTEVELLQEIIDGQISERNFGVLADVRRSRDERLQAMMRRDNPDGPLTALPPPPQQPAPEGPRQPPTMASCTPDADFACQLSPNFTMGEFVANANERRFRNQGQVDVAAQLASFLETARARYGPLVVTSGHRPTEVNRREGGSENSEHLYPPGVGAVDVAPVEGDIREFERWVERSWPHSVGRGAHRGFVHIGIGRGRRRWGYG